MAAGNWTEIAGTRQITQGIDGIVAVQQFQSLTTATTDTEHDVLTAGNAKKIADPYGPNILLRVESVSARQFSREQPLNWVVTVTYSTSVPEDKDEVFAEPTRRPPEVSITQITHTKAVETIPDYFDRDVLLKILPLENSAGEPYDPPIEVESVDMAIVVRQNFADFHPNDILGYKGAVNNDKWEGFDEGTAWIADITYVRVTENGLTFWKRTVEIHVREKTGDYNWDTIYPWQVLKLNEGVQQLDSGLDQIIFCTTLDGEIVPSLAKLNDVGRQLLQSDDATYKRWDVFPKKDFADLNIRLI